MDKLDPSLPYQVLHCHTVVSDGKLTYEEILEECQKNEIGLVAFTDHDSAMTAGKFEELSRSSCPVKIISGTEITVNYLDDNRKIIAGDLHLTGLFVDPNNPGFKTYKEKAVQKREECARQFINNLKNYGFDIDFEEVKKLTTGQIGRPHIASALIANEKNREIIDRDFRSMLKKFAEDGLSNEDLSVFNDHSEVKRVFDLYLDDKSFVPGIFINSPNDVTLNNALDLIHRAGGIALPAHWSDYKKTLTPERLEELCRDGKIDGLETNYGYWDVGFELEESQQDISFLKDLCVKYDLLQGGGGDYHRREDFTQAKLSAYSFLREETRNLLQKMLQVRPDLDLKWSSLKK